MEGEKEIDERKKRKEEKMEEEVGEWGIEESKGTLCSYMRLGRRCLRRVFSPRFDQVEGASGMRDESTVTR